MHYTNLTPLYNTPIEWLPEIPSTVALYQSDQGLVKHFKIGEQEFWLEPADSQYLPLHTGRNITISFPITEAEEHGFVIPCNFQKAIPGYQDLSCDPKNLQQPEELEGEYGVGYENSKIIYQCQDCNQKWLIHRIFDSQSMNRRICTAVEE